MGCDGIVGHGSRRAGKQCSKPQKWRYVVSLFGIDVATVRTFCEWHKHCGVYDIILHTDMGSVTCKSFDGPWARSFTAEVAADADE